MTATRSSEELIRLLNSALGWELRAQLLYAHYAAYVKGIRERVERAAKRLHINERVAGCPQ